MESTNYRHYLLIGIFILAVFFRLVRLSSGDPLSDETLYSFRSIGMIDYYGSADHPSPLQLFDPHYPWWAHLSFHDHPPLVFFVQHVFMSIFGENRFAFRLPSALLGVISVYLLYLIARHLYSETAGLFAAALLAITANHVTVSRLGLQESYVIFFLLLSTYLFLKALQDKRYFVWTGMALGLALLSKYTAMVAIPIFLCYLLMFHRNLFRVKEVWIGGIIAFALCSPIIIYNYELYKSTGHFDLQLSYITKQSHPEWDVALGYERSPFSTRIISFIPQLINYNSWLLLLLFVTSSIVFLYFFWRNPKEAIRKHAFVFLCIFWTAMFILETGPELRFLFLMTPFLVLVIGAFLDWLYIVCIERSKMFIYPALAVVFLFEIAYSVNTQVFYYPRGQKPIMYSGLRNENYNWGYNELDDYLTNELKNRMPANTLKPLYTFIANIQQKGLSKAEKQGYEQYPALIIYDENIQIAAKIWIFDRLELYHGWPTISSSTYMEHLQGGGVDYIIHPGGVKIYVIVQNNNIPWKATPTSKGTTDLIEDTLKNRGIDPSIRLKNKRDEEVFRIYVL